MPLAATTYYFRSKDELIGEALAILVEDEIDAGSASGPRELGEGLRSPSESATALAEVLFPDARRRRGAARASSRSTSRRRGGPSLREPAAHWQDALHRRWRRSTLAAGAGQPIPSALAPLARRRHRRDPRRTSSRDGLAGDRDVAAAAGAARAAVRTRAARAPRAPAGHAAADETPCLGPTIACPCARPTHSARPSKAEGVEHVFGIPGGANLPIYDALYDADLTHIQARHEQGAGHAAEGYAKASGRVGVAIATSGPGATNLVTPIADAMMDSVPTVFITGQVRTDLIGTDGFQEADVTGITLPIVKHSFLVTDPRQIPDYIHEAFHIASTGRPGPVLVDVPQDLSRADIDYAPTEGTPELPGYKPPTEGNIKQIRIAAKALANARRPVIYGGGGIVNANASEEFRELLRLRQAPGDAHGDGPRRLPGSARAVARDARHARHPHRQLRDGRGRPDRRVGARFDDRITGKLSEFAPRAKFVHIDVDPAEISKNVPAHIPIVGDAADVLPKLTREYRALKPDSARLDEWWKQIRDWQTDLPAALRGLAPTPRSSRSSWSRRCTRRPRATRSSPPTSASTRCGRRSTTTSPSPRRWINSGGLGTMGFGLPAAIGAKVALPRRAPSSASPATAAW